MRIAITGASGNIGTSLIRALGDDPRVQEVIGIARRRPDVPLAKTSWVQADVGRADLSALFEGVDVVVHLAWLIQPSHDALKLRATNVEGSARVFHGAGAAGVRALVYASSVGAYSAGPKDTQVDESWPTGGVLSSQYARHKVEVERLLDRFEATHPEIRCVRLRPGLVFKRDAASEIRRYFAGPFLPGGLLRRELVPVLPTTRRLVFQAVHSHDVGEAFRLAALEDRAQGAYNVAAQPVLDRSALSRVFGDARGIETSPRVLRAAAALSWRLRLQPTEPGWLDLALGVPLMDSSRIRDELGWEPERRADEALAELMDGIRDGAGYPTPPLDPGAGGPLRAREILTGVGGS